MGNQKWTIQRNWQINVREYRKTNQKWQHSAAHKTQDEVRNNTTQYELDTTMRKQ